MSLVDENNTGATFIKEGNLLLTAYATNGRDTAINPVMFLLDASEPLCEGLVHNTDWETKHDTDDAPLLLLARGPTRGVHWPMK